MTKHELLFFITLICCPFQSSGVNYIKIGGVFFDESNPAERSAFNLGIDYVNNDTLLLPDTILVPVLSHTNWTDAFANIDAVYGQIHNGVSAIVGPMTSSTIKATQPLCAGFHIPQIAPYATDPSFDFSPDSYSYLVRMSPSDTVENCALADLVSYFNWTRIAVLASRDDYGLNGLVVFKDIASHKGWTLVAVESFQVHEDISLLNATKQLFHIRSRGARIVVLNAVGSHVRVILRQASDLGMIDGWVWLVTNGAFAFDGLYVIGGTVPEYLQGIVGIRHSFGLGMEHKKFVNMWESSGYKKAILDKDVAVGHTFDAVMVIARAIHNMSLDGKNLTVTTGLTLSAHRSNPSMSHSLFGETLLDYISKVNTSGVMDSHVAFDANRHPVGGSFDIVNLRSSGFNKVGKWDLVNGLVMEKNKEILWSSGKTTVPGDTTLSIVNQTLSIVTIEERPFVTKTILNHRGKYILTGYCIDLIEKLKEKFKFSYEIYLVPDGSFGSQDSFTKEWNGMVKEILQGKAHLAVASFTISSERQKVIDFTQPFIDLGLTVLIKPERDEGDFFIFLRPFKGELWLVTGVTAILIGGLLWFFSTFSPFGFYGRCLQIAHHKVPREHLKRKHTLSLANSIWSSTAYIGQSADSLHPISFSGRITVFVWWFTIVILVSTYTANLAAFLTTKGFSSPISSIEDLAGQNAIPYGTVTNSQPMSFFENSVVPSFVSMWQYMKYHHTLVENSKEGIEKVKNSNYAFIWDSIVLEYTTHTAECGTLTTTGSLFGKIGYGIGLSKNSPYSHQLSQAILELRQGGFMDQLEQKWLHFHGSRCSEQHIEIGVDRQLGLADVAGAFIIICCGVGISFIVLIIEWLAASYAVTKEDDPDAPKTLWESFQMRRRITLDDWTHRKDVPEILKFSAASNAMKNIARLPLVLFTGLRLRRLDQISPEIEAEEVKSEGSSLEENVQTEDGNGDHEQEVIIDFQP